MDELDSKDGWQFEFAGQLNDRAMPTVGQAIKTYNIFETLLIRIEVLEKEVSTLKAIEKERWESGIGKLKKAVGE